MQHGLNEGATTVQMCSQTRERKKTAEEQPTVEGASANKIEKVETEYACWQASVACTIATIRDISPQPGT